MSPTAQDYHKKMKDVWTEAEREVRGPEVKAAYRLFLWLLDNGIMAQTSPGGLQGIREELAMFQSNPTENWKVRFCRFLPNLRCQDTNISPIGTDPQERVPGSVGLHLDTLAVKPNLSRHAGLSAQHVLSQRQYHHMARQTLLYPSGPLSIRVDGARIEEFNPSLSHRARHFRVRRQRRNRTCLQAHLREFDRT